MNRGLIDMKLANGLIDNSLGGLVYIDGDDARGFFEGGELAG